MFVCLNLCLFALFVCLYLCLFECLFALCLSEKFCNQINFETNKISLHNTQIIKMRFALAMLALSAMVAVSFAQFPEDFSGYYLTSKNNCTDFVSLSVCIIWLIDAIDLELMILWMLKFWHEIFFRLFFCFFQCLIFMVENYALKTIGFGLFWFFQCNDDIGISLLFLGLIFLQNWKISNLLFLFVENLLLAICTLKLRLHFAFKCLSFDWLVFFFFSPIILFFPHYFIFM